METVVQSPALAPMHWVSNHVREWLTQCADFRRWEREKLLLQDPPAESLAEHRKLARYMISTTRLMLAVISDPEFSDRSLRESVEGVLAQLEDSWEMLHNPMPHEEAEAILSRAFPG